MDAVGFSWSDPYRWLRIVEVLDGGTRFSMADMMRLQTDELSLPARQLVPMLEELSATGRVEEVRRRLLAWDFVMDKRSVEAAVYDAWESELRRAIRDAVVPPGADMNLSLRKVIEAVIVPPGVLGDDPMRARDRILLGSLADAVSALEEKLGPDMTGWQYGQPDNHHAYLRHPLGNAVDADTRDLLEVGPLPRGGYGSTVNQTGNGDNQTSGASFRIIVDTGDWDRAVGMNTPGQSGDVRSPFYENLFEFWANDQFHPVFYSRDRVEGVTARRIELQPGR
jgi:penicillin amidase